MMRLACRLFGHKWALAEQYSPIAPEGLVYCCDRPWCRMIHFGPFPRKLRCLLAHKWVDVYSDGPHKERQCSKCGVYQSSMYDMTYGCSYWTPGRLWSPERKRHG